MFHYCSRLFIANHTGCVTSISRNHICVLSNNTAKLPFTHVYDASRCHVTSPGQGFVSLSSWAPTLTTQWRRPEHFSSKTLSTSLAQPMYSLPMIFLTQRPSLIRPYWADSMMITSSNRHVALKLSKAQYCFCVATETNTRDTYMRCREGVGVIYNAVQEVRVGSKNIRGMCGHNSDRIE